jgi:opacity protein-like surface antigen
MRKLILVLALCIIPASLFAQDDGWRNRGGRYDRDRNYADNSFDLTPFVGYRWGGTLAASETNLFRRDLDLDSSASFGASIGIPISRTGMKFELLVDHQATSLTTGSSLFTPGQNFGDFDVTYYHAGLLIPFSQTRGVEPFFVVSAGLANLDPRVSNASSDNRFSASVGAGVRLPVNRNIGIKIEGRGFFTSLNNDNSDSCVFCNQYSTDRNLYQGEVNVGLSMRF